MSPKKTAPVSEVQLELQNIDPVKRIQMFCSPAELLSQSAGPPQTSSVALRSRVQLGGGQFGYVTEGAYILHMEGLEIIASRLMVMTRVCVFR